jgi:membrane-bound lytic murein transglycosylase B
VACVVVSITLGSVAVAPASAAPTPPDEPKVRPVDDPVHDLVLDDVEVVPTAATREADRKLAEAGRDEGLRALAWQEATTRRVALVQLSQHAAEVVGQAEQALAAARRTEDQQRSVLRERRRVERERLHALQVQQAELRRLAAAVVASAPTGDVPFLGDQGDYSAGDRRNAVRERSMSQQTRRVVARTSPWRSARRARRAQDRRVATAVRDVARSANALATATADRNNVVERLNAAAALEATRVGELLHAHERSQAARIGRREARLLAPVKGEDLPLVALHAYWVASGAAPCFIPWWVLAGVGRIETRHGTAQGSSLLADGSTTVHILGIPLDGRPGTFPIHDTDGGLLDGDPVWDRAVGPMQFIPGTWHRWATDDSGDGTADPHNIYDAAGAAANYLCFNHGDLTDDAKIRAALLSYNHSVPYGNEVMAHGQAYRDDLKLPDVPPVLGGDGKPTDGAASTAGN